jgi:hypothetical protein
MSRPPLKDTNNTNGLIGLGPIPDQAPVASFNADGIENLLQTKGFVAYHVKSAPNPDRSGVSSPVNPNTIAAQRGHIYYSARPLKIVPQRISLEDRLNVQGIWGVGTALFNVTGTYIDDAKNKDRIVQVRPHDLIIMPTLTILVDQMFEYNPTGPQRLNHRVLGVDVLMDNKNVYEQGVDFILQNGEIVWTKTGNKPFFSQSGGSVLSIVYWTMPIYIVQQMPHNLRVIPSNEVGHGSLPREAVYAPQLVVAKPSTIVDENLKNQGIEALLDWKAIPNLPEYPSSSNSTGGSL